MTLTAAGGFGAVAMRRVAEASCWRWRYVLSSGGAVTGDKLVGDSSMVAVVGNVEAAEGLTDSVA